MRVQRGVVESNERWVTSEHPSTENRRDEREYREERRDEIEERRQN